ncbi:MULTISPECIES: urease accessory protein UreE [unclassified Dysgonomonas]|uniref:urease accessory protein UreE n=1 Tax=unclassified Dysgonomonas TaxID=2630389 RepID=UPI0013EC11EB|nr:MULTISPECIES: urease accessory protein UreE [unclassified Dysgonomonas]
MVVEQIAGNLKDVKVADRKVELIQMEWFEANKRIQRRKTIDGTDVAIRFMKEGQRLRQDDILYMDDDKIIAVDILPCDAIQVTPHTMLEMGSVSYEIGNKHLPVFIQDDLILIPYEEPIFKWLKASGYHTEKVHKKLLNIVNASVQPHSHSHGEGSSIFSKIMGLAK